MQPVGPGGAPAPHRKERRMAVEVGQQAPDFTLMDGDRREHQLSEYRGRPVVVAWYVLAFTGG